MSHRKELNLVNSEKKVGFLWRKRSLTLCRRLGKTLCLCFITVSIHCCASHKRFQSLHIFTCQTLQFVILSHHEDVFVV